MQETILKVVLPILTAAILGMFGWVWNTSTNVTLLKSDITYLKQDLVEAKQQSSDLMERVNQNKEMLIELQRDMKYIKITLQSIGENLEKEK